jgi:acetyl esterase/lipase
MYPAYRTVALLLVCSLATPPATADDVVVEKNIVYGKAGDLELKLDLVRAAQGHRPSPAIVFIHGGGWYQGNRQGYLADCREAARRGYVALTISYRLMQFDNSKKETTTAAPIFPAQIHDAKTAIRWLRANALKYNVDENRIGVTGGSAGGHLALLVGLTGVEAKLEGRHGHPDASSRVQAVVNVYGPTEMASLHATSSVSWIFRLFLGGTPQQVPDRYQEASPTTYASAEDPPVLTIHGDRDRLVPLQQAHLLDQKLKAAGAPHTLLVLPGQGHGFRGQAQQRAAEAKWRFFKKHLKP